jgi:hypothetical protein
MVAYTDGYGEFLHPHCVPELEALVDAYYEQWQEDNGSPYGAPSIYEVVARVTANSEEFSEYTAMSAYGIDEYETALSWEYGGDRDYDDFMGQAFVYCAQCDERIES